MLHVVDKASVNWLEHLTSLHRDYFIFHFYMTKATKLSAASLFQVCICFSSPDSLRPLCALVHGESLRILPRASPYKPEDGGKT